MVLVGRLPEILPEILVFILIIGNYEVRYDRQIEIAVIYGCGHPVYEPGAPFVEQDIFRLQVHVAKHQIPIGARVTGADLPAPPEGLFDLAFGKRPDPRNLQMKR